MRACRDAHAVLRGRACRLDDDDVIIILLVLAQPQQQGRGRSGRAEGVQPGDPQRGAVAAAARVRGPGGAVPAGGALPL